MENYTKVTSVKQLEYSQENFPVAKFVEDKINNCSSDEMHLSALMENLTEETLKMFLFGCISLWAETEMYDDRNRFAVLLSREIIKEFPVLKAMNTDREMQKECYGFVNYAHRYLQNSFFNAALTYLRNTGFLGIHQWYVKQEFVYNRTGDRLIKYSDYKLGIDR